MSSDTTGFVIPFFIHGLCVFISPYVLTEFTLANVPVRCSIDDEVR